MGYAKGIRWTDELIADAIMAVANQFDPPRMPSNDEAKRMTGSCALSNAISKNGGYKHWADKLGLAQKHSETKLGIEGERYLAELLQTMGYRVETTSANHPYDLLIDGCVKVDVKTAKTSYIRGCPVHAYRLAKKQQTCDFYIFYEYDTLRVYVVPAHKCQGQVQVEMGYNSKLYAKYLGAFHLIKEASDMYRRM